MHRIARVRAVARRVARRRVVVGLTVGALVIGGGAAALGAAPRDHTVASDAGAVIESGSGVDAAVVVRPRTPNGRVAMFCHGHGEGAHTVLDGHVAGVVDELVRAGYTVVGSDGAGDNWGDAAGVAAYRQALAHARARYDLHGTYLIAESMGDLACQQVAAADPDTRALAAIFPVYDASRIRPDLVAHARSVWSEARFATVAPVTPAARVPMLVWASHADTKVPYDSNAAALVARVRAAGGTARLVTTVGEHGDPSNFQAADVLRFFDAH